MIQEAGQQNIWSGSCFFSLILLLLLLQACRGIAGGTTRAWPLGRPAAGDTPSAAADEAATDRFLLLKKAHLLLQGPAC
jgi:hypothetical protein